MAMNATDLKNEIVAELITRGFDPLNVANNNQAEAYIDAFAAGIVNHIQANAQAIDVGTPTVPAGNWPIV